ncbi:MAG: hypothetical protein KDA21_09270, partial [Phycisphaerales bacterium]|nr:hypothetical protein [Phycisphaerales bacterium]
MPRLAALALLAATATTQAQVSNWTNLGVGDWLDAANWSAGIPGAGEHAFFTNGGTAQIIGGTTPLHQTTSLGTNSSSAVGYLEIDGGGILNSTYIQVGHHGYGELTISGSTSEINAQFIRLAGNLPTAMAVMTINDGDITLSGDFTTAWYGTGQVYQHGGSVMCSQVICGNLSAAQSYYVMDGGTLTTPVINCAAGGLGDFTQKGTAYVDTTNLRIPVTTGTGIYRLQGGTLEAGNITRSASAVSSTFEMIGGRLNVGTFGQTSTHWDLTVQGGTLCPADAGVGTTHVWGRWAQGNASNYEVTFNSPGSYDTTIAEDGVLLAGKITLVLNSAPASSTTLLVGQNNSAAPITGTFFGLPEGATVVGTFGATSYNFAIS